MKHLEQTRVLSLVSKAMDTLMIGTLGLVLSDLEKLKDESNDLQIKLGYDHGVTAGLGIACDRVKKIIKKRKTQS